ncbi:MAG: hypothetical protein EX272_03255 [Chromatiales bacterium]|nr:MAG: hypothetical protein EX272_03255 [Chromatiales bacterium]
MKMKYLCIGTGAAALLIAPAFADDHDDEEIPWDVAEVFFELNNTDGDLGIHALVDGGPWKRMQIEDADGRTILNVHARGRLRRQGMTEIFFESAEPTFDELAPEQFFNRFPEGTYEVEGQTLDGEELENETEITHAMPAPPAPTVNGVAAAMQCDDEEPGYDAPVIEADEYVIAWPEVALTHPSLGYPQSSSDITIVNYEVVVEVELETPDGEEFTTVFSVILPPDVTAMTIPEEFLEQSDSFKYEVLAREESWNQTAIESCFLTEVDD